ncbi:MAG: TetR/AcrR family transcriptional regulator [Myxococcaceae bacterium]|nr:TetR/AcrR family transcriptional regulator [Myxococcaceae bacterium]
MGRPRQISDEQILSTMRRKVRAEGPNVSLNGVAAELGVTVPALLKRFSTRQALMLAALKPPYPPWLELLERGPDDRPLHAQLLELFTAMLDFFAEYIPCMIALRESGISPRLYTTKPAPGKAVEAMQGWLRRARRKGLIFAPEIETAAFSILGTVQGRSFYSYFNKVPFPPSEQQAYASQLAQLFTRALSTRTPRRRRGRPERAAPAV